MGIPLNHPFVDGFSIINHPAIGDPMIMETRICQDRLALALPRADEASGCSLRTGQQMELGSSGNFWDL